VKYTRPRVVVNELSPTRIRNRIHQIVGQMSFLCFCRRRKNRKSLCNTSQFILMSSKKHCATVKIDQDFVILTLIPWTLPLEGQIGFLSVPDPIPNRATGSVQSLSQSEVAIGARGYKTFRGPTMVFSGSAPCGSNLPAKTIFIGPE